MIRVIAGTYRHREIYQPNSKDVRPTKDIVRGAIFSALGNINDLKVLDVFCGSGAFGIESLSRGAIKVDFIDVLDLCLNCVRNTCERFEIEKSKYNLFKGDYKDIMPNLKKNKYDLIFADPPYKEHIFEDLVKIINEYDLLSDEGRIIYECEDKLQDIEGYEYKEYHYGRAKVGIYRKIL